MKSIDDLLELSFIRFRQILLRKPSYFTLFEQSSQPFCAFSSLSSSPHTPPKFLNRSLYSYDILRFLYFLLCYVAKILFSIFFSDHLFISSYRWSSRSQKYKSTLSTLFPESLKSSYLFFKSYLDTSSTSSSLLPCILFRPIINSILQSSSFASSSNVDLQYRSSTYNFIPADSIAFRTFLNQSRKSGDINALLLFISTLLFKLLVQTFNLFYLFFPKCKLFYIATNCWNITDYLFYVLSFSKFDIKLIGCQHGCYYFESNDLFTELEINSPCFIRYISFGDSSSQFLPDDVLRLVPQTGKFDIVYVMRYFPEETLSSGFISFMNTLVTCANRYKIQIRIHPKSHYIKSLLLSKFKGKLFFDLIDLYIADSKKIGLPICTIALYDSPFSTLLWHSSYRNIESIFVSYDKMPSSISYLYSKVFDLGVSSSINLLPYLETALSYPHP